MILLLNVFSGSAIWAYDVPSSITNGDQLRQNENSPEITSVDRAIFLDCDLVIPTNQTFTDNNATYQFSKGKGFRPQPGSTVELKDVNIIYSGEPKNEVSSGEYYAKYTRVKFIQAERSGKSDFFANANHKLEFDGVDISMNGEHDELYLKTTSSIKNMIVYSYVGSNLYLGPDETNQKSNFSNLKLQNIDTIIGDSEAYGTVEIRDFIWDTPIWNIVSNDVNFKLVNPTKPKGWLKYSDEAVNVSEYSTHQILLLDQNRNAVQNTNVMLFNKKQKQFDYKSISNNMGITPEKEVLFFNGSINGPWDLIISKYDKEYFVRQRMFDKKISEEIILLEDRAITETNEITVQNYKKTDNSSQLYDLAKLWKVQDANIKQPELTKLLIEREGRELHVPKGWNLRINKDTTPDRAFFVDTNKKLITIKTDVLKAGRYDRLKLTDGAISTKSDEFIDFPYSDSINDSYVRFVGLGAYDELIIRDKSDTKTLATYTGECGFSYKSEPGNELIIIYNAANGGDKARYRYDMKHSGLGNYFRVAVGELNMDAMFTTTDRRALRSAVDKIVEALEKNDEELDQILFWLQLLIHKVQPNQQRYTY
jgi:hypothetical protein